MKFFVLVLLQVLRVGAFCSYNSAFLKAQSSYLNILENMGPINFIFNYELLEVPAKNISPHVFYYDIGHREVSFYEPILFIEMQRIKNHFEIRTNSIFRKTSDLVKYQEVKDLNINLNLLKDKKCSNDLKSLAWKLKIYDSMCFMMFACHVSPENLEGVFEVEKRVILLTDQQFNLTKDNDYEFSGLHFDKKLNEFSPFGEESFCMCDFLDSYFNKCRIERKESQYRIFLVIFTFIACAYALFEIYSCIVIRRKNIKIFPEI